MAHWALGHNDLVSFNHYFPIKNIEWAHWALGHDDLVCFDLFCPIQNIEGAHWALGHNDSGHTGARAH